MKKSFNLSNTSKTSVANAVPCDIVRLLRVWATDVRFPKDYAINSVKKHLAEAADEIESLRKIGRGVK